MGGIAMSKGNGTSNGAGKNGEHYFNRDGPVRLEGRVFFPLAKLDAYATPEAAAVIVESAGYTTLFEATTRNKAKRFGAMVSDDDRLTHTAIADQEERLFVDVAAGYEGMSNVKSVSGFSDSYIEGVGIQSRESIDQLAALDALDGPETHDGGLDEGVYTTLTGHYVGDVDLGEGYGHEEPGVDLPVFDERPVHLHLARELGQYDDTVDLTPASSLVDTGEFKVDRSGPEIVAVPVDPLAHLVEAGDQYDEAQAYQSALSSQAMRSRDVTQETQL